MKMGNDELGIRERIVAAVIVCIERVGLESTGIREIAREAHVNSAAISYYFGSKDRLVALALEQTLDQAFGHVLVDFDQLRADGVEVREAFERVMDEQLTNSTRYPRIAYAHMREALVHQRYDTAPVQRLNTFLVELARRLAPAAPDVTPEALRLALTHVWSSMVLLAMAPRLFEGFVALDFESPEQRRAWVALQSRLVFNG
ncbi:TetR/AcrR family transcriptional regulator [Myxococcaceae bacterium GXIMD 01537]